MKTKRLIAFRILFFAIALLSLQGCIKDSILPIVKVENSSEHTYKIEVDGEVYGNVSGKSTREFSIPPGTWNLKATQTQGYLIFPTVKEITYDLRSGDVVTWKIPF